MKRKEAFYAVIGGVVGTVLTLAVCTLSPLGAQSQSGGNFGKITCTEIEVVRLDGTRGARIFVNDNGGRVVVYGKTGTLTANSDLVYGDGGFVGVLGSNGTPQATMGVWESDEGESGGRVHVYGSDKLPGLDFGFPQATIGGGEDGGSFNISNADGGSIRMYADSETARVIVYGKSYKPGLYRAAEMSVSKHGGIVNVRGKDGLPKAGMGGSELGGFVNVRGKDGESNATIGVLGDGGFVSVRFKDGSSGAVVRADEDGGRVAVIGTNGESKAFTSDGLE